MSNLDKYIRKTIVEKGEYVRDTQGKVFKVDQSPTHNDSILIDGDTAKKVKRGKGGLALPNIESVVSSTHERRNSKDPLYTEKDEEIKIDPNEAVEFSKGLKLNIKKPKKGISPSKLIDLNLESVDKYSKKFNKQEYTSDMFSTNSAQANKIVYENLPDINDIYEEALSLQESKKSVDNTNYAQTGLLNSLNEGDRLVKEEKEFLNNWINSERFSKKLKENLIEIDNKKSDPKYQGWFDKLIENSPEEDVELLKSEALNYLDTVKVYGTDKPENRKLLSNEFSKLYDESKYEKLYREGFTKGIYKPYKHSVWLNNINDTGTKTHELTHSSKLDNKLKSLIPNSEVQEKILNNFNEKYKTKDLKLSSGMFGKGVLYKDPSSFFDQREYILSGEDLKKDIKEQGYDLNDLLYIEKGSEVYPRIMSIRKRAGLKPEDVIDDKKMEEIYNKTKDEGLYQFFNKKQIKDLLNKLAYNPIEKTNKISQTGGIKGKLLKYPHMDGTRPTARVQLADGRVVPVEILDDSYISMDDLFYPDSVQVKGNKAKTFYDFKNKKYKK